MICVYTDALEGEVHLVPSLIVGTTKMKKAIAYRESLAE
jgi:hypothetical protein